MDTTFKYKNQNTHYIIITLSTILDPVKEQTIKMRNIFTWYIYYYIYITGHELTIFTFLKGTIISLTIPILFQCKTDKLHDYTMYIQTTVKKDIFARA